MRASEVLRAVAKEIMDNAKSQIIKRFDERVFIDEWLENEQYFCRSKSSCYSYNLRTGELKERIDRYMQCLK